MTDKGLDFTLELFVTGSNAYTDQMALLIDNNETTCITLTKCLAGSKYILITKQILTNVMFLFLK